MKTSEGRKIKLIKKFADILYIKVTKIKKKKKRCVLSSLPRLSLAFQPDAGDKENVGKSDAWSGLEWALM